MTEPQDVLAVGFWIVGLGLASIGILLTLAKALLLAYAEFGLWFGIPMIVAGVGLSGTSFIGVRLYEHRDRITDALSPPNTED